MISFLLNHLIEIITIGIVAGFGAAAIRLEWQKSTEVRQDHQIIDREMASAPREPVHPDVLELVINRDERGGHLPEDASEMDAVRNATLRTQ